MAFGGRELTATANISNLAGSNLHPHTYFGDADRKGRAGSRTLDGNENVEHTETSAGRREDRGKSFEGRGQNMGAYRIKNKEYGQVDGLGRSGERLHRRLCSRRAYCLTSLCVNTFQLGS